MSLVRYVFVNEEGRIVKELLGDGEIMPLNDVYANVPEGGSAYQVSHEMDVSMYYFEGGQAKLRPSFTQYNTWAGRNVMVGEAMSFGPKLPEGTQVTVSPGWGDAQYETLEVNDGTFVFVADKPGLARIAFEKFPYQPYEDFVTVHSEG